jgi:hypothetical protein
MPPWTMTEFGPDGVVMTGQFSRFHVGGNNAVHGGVIPLFFDWHFGMIVSAAGRANSRTAYLHLIVPRERFRLLQGEESLTIYTFNTGTAKHRFCSHCGIKSFYVPRSHPDGFSVNARCIDSPTVTGMKIHAVDGRNWEKHYPAGRGEFTA